MSEVEAASDYGRRQGPVGRYRRTIRVRAEPGLATAEMEDDVHHFMARLHHAGGVVTKVEGAAPRTPWVSCPGALMELKTLEGLTLEAVRALPAPARREHCLHLFEVALIAASHAGDAPFERTYRIDADHDAAQPRLTLWRDGREVLSWAVDEMVVRGSRFDGIALADIPRRLGGLSADEKEAALVLRRASLISFVRTIDMDAVTSSGAMRANPDETCYAKKSYRIAEAVRATGTSRDFWKDGTWPLEG